MLMASMARTKPTRMGTYRSIPRRPPSSASGSRKAGTLPRITSSSGGKARAKNHPVGSRQNNLASVRVSLASLLMGTAPLRLSFRLLSSWSVVQPAAGQGDEGIVQAGLLGPEVGGDDVVAGQDRSDGLEQVAGAGHQHPGAPAGPPPPLRQVGEQPVLQRRGGPEAQALFRFDPGHQPGRAVD